MKHLFVIFIALLSITFVISSPDTCGSDSQWQSEGYACKFTCTPNGVKVDCNAPGCRCNDGRLYYNTDTKTCMEVKCDNMDCVGEENQQFFAGCESGSRNRCGCARIMTMDCR